MSIGQDKPNMDVCELIVKTLEGTVDEESFHRLESMLAMDERVRRYYAAFVKMWVHLDALVQTDPVTQSSVEAFEGDDSILRDVITEDLEARQKGSCPSPAQIEEIRRITEEQLQKYLWETRCPLTKTPLPSRDSSYVREYFLYQAQRLIRPLKFLAACLVITLAIVFIFNYFDNRPRLRHANNAWVMREGEKMNAPGVSRLQEGDVIVTDDGGEAVICYRGENTTLRLKENSHFVMVSYKKGKHYELKYGAMDAIVAPQPVEQPMTIHSEQGTCQVLGTHFQISSNPLGSWLAVRDGRVRLTRKWDQEAIEVEGGQYTIAAQGMELTTRPFNDNMDLSKDFWQVWPHALGSRSIAMQAIGALNNSSIEYYFECVSGTGHDSGWQKSPLYQDENLQPDSEYAYRLRVRRAGGDETVSPWSLVAATRTTFAVTIEAESAELTGILKVKEDTAASGGKCLYSKYPSLPFTYPDARKNKASYVFNIPQSGYYRIRGMCYGSDIHRNSFFVLVDGRPEEAWLWDILPSKEYAQDYVNDRDKVDPVEIWLDRGEHTMDLCVREDGVYLDWLELERIPNR